MRHQTLDICSLFTQARDVKQMTGVSTWAVRRDFRLTAFRSEVKNDSRVGGRKARTCNSTVKSKSIDINPLKAVFCYGLVTEEQGLVLAVAEMKHLEQVLEYRMTFCWNTENFSVLYHKLNSLEGFYWERYCDVERCNECDVFELPSFTFFENTKSTSQQFCVLLYTVNELCFMQDQQTVSWTHTYRTGHGINSAWMLLVLSLMVHLPLLPCLFWPVHLVRHGILCSLGLKQWAAHPVMHCSAHLLVRERCMASAAQDGWSAKMHLGYPGGDPDPDLPNKGKLKHALAFAVKERSWSALPQPLSMSLLTYPSSDRILFMRERRFARLSIGRWVWS